MIDLSRARLAPFRHQVEDVQAVVDHPYFFITSEMRTGKSKIIIDSAQVLYEQGKIDRLIIIAPAPVRDVWFDRSFGELSKHLWLSTSATISEYHARTRTWLWPNDTAQSNSLAIIVTNFEFIRSKPRLATLLSVCGPKTFLVLDESSFVKSHSALQTKACMELRKKCGRICLLNGTPISHSPLDLFSQANLLHPSVLDCKYVTYFKARYAKMSPVLSHGKPLISPYGKPIQTITGWMNLDDLQRRMAPYVVRRLQKDCLDLPAKLDPVTLTAELTPATWKIYKSMRDELVVWLEENRVATSAQAAVKTMRLAQITSGFVGGVERSNIDEWGELPETDFATFQYIGREKLDVLLWFYGQQLEANTNQHSVAWFRFRPELFRAVKEVKEKYPHVTVASIMGDQKKVERREAMALLHPDTSLQSPVFVGGIYGTGSFGLNFTAANTSINCSFDFSPGRFKQSSDRVYGPGMIGPAAYFDIIARGPRGEKTIDHHIVAARRASEDIATWTTDHWVRKLMEE